MNLLPNNYRLSIRNQFLEAVYQEFLDKCEEIEKFISFIDTLDGGRNNTIHSINTETNKQETHIIDTDINKTLRASVYLLIYNMLESTMCNAIDSIHETLHHENIDLNDLSDKFKKIVFHNLRNDLNETNINKIIQEQIDIREKILKHGYNKKNLLSGNLTVDIVLELARKYDFLVRPVVEREGVYRPDIIKKIKLKRNALAHGSQSFFECGRDTVIFSLKGIYYEAYKLLLAVFLGLDNSLFEKKYLRS